MKRIQPHFRRILAQTTAVLADPRHRGIDLVFIPPCYWLVNHLNSDSVILDFGLGLDADFSQDMIARYGLVSHGFDPTHRHQPTLRQVEQSSGGRFHYHALAIGASRGSTTFHESQKNISGSLLSGHYNVRHDATTDYEVQVATLEDAMALAPGDKAKLVKMDIEGSEYDVLDGTPDSALQKVDQWIIDFHHDVIAEIPYSRTRQQVGRFRSLGYRVYTQDKVNFLFYR